MPEWKMSNIGEHKIVADTSIITLGCMIIIIYLSSFVLYSMPANFAVLFILFVNTYKSVYTVHFCDSWMPVIQLTSLYASCVFWNLMTDTLHGSFKHFCLLLNKNEQILEGNSKNFQ